MIEREWFGNMISLIKIASDILTRQKVMTAGYQKVVTHHTLIHIPQSLRPTAVMILCLETHYLSILYPSIALCMINDIIYDVCFNLYELWKPSRRFNYTEIRKTNLIIIEKT